MNPVFRERRYLIPFRAMLLPQIFTDVLVIGSGVAGMRAALAAAQHSDVILATKADLQDSNTFWAQGGVAAVLDRADSFDDHIADTLTAGAGLCDVPAVRLVVEQAPHRIEELLRWGMRIDRTAKGEIALGREGGHSHPRIVHSDGDATGKELARVLIEQARGNERIRLFSNCFVLDLITLNGAADGAASPCIGAITHHPRYGLQVIWARATILASGGCGQMYRESTNPAVATGDGLAMAYRAGAQIMDAAFMQFHPTTLYVAGAARQLISEAVRGEGALLTDRHGHRFMPDYHPQAELAPRDIVSRAILAQMAKTGSAHVYLDCRGIDAERFRKRFPGITDQLRKFEIDPAQDPIPIHPSAHYMVGGVRTDLEARSSVPGLYACGEAACTGLHGANRLASNSLLEGLVFGEIAGRVCQETADRTDRAAVGARPPKIVSDIPLSERSELDLADVRSSLRSVLWRHVGIERRGDRLEEVAEMFDFWARYTLDKIFDERAGWEVQNLLLTGALVTHAALWRAESRGVHYRTDCPEASEPFHVHDLWSRFTEGPGTQPVGEGAAREEAGAV